MIVPLLLKWFHQMPTTSVHRCLVRGSLQGGTRLAGVDAGAVEQPFGLDQGIAADDQEAELAVRDGR